MNSILSLTSRHFRTRKIIQVIVSFNFCFENELLFQFSFFLLILTKYHLCHEPNTYEKNYLLMKTTGSQTSTRSKQIQVLNYIPAVSFLTYLQIQTYFRITFQNIQNREACLLTTVNCKKTASPNETTVYLSISTVFAHKI